MACWTSTSAEAIFSLSISRDSSLCWSGNRFFAVCFYCLIWCPNILGKRWRNGWSGTGNEQIFKGGLIYLLLYFNSLNSCNVLALAVSLVLCGTAACPCLALSNTSTSLLQNKHIYHLITNYFVFVYSKLKEYTWKTYKVLQHKRHILFLN